VPRLTRMPLAHRALALVVLLAATAAFGGTEYAWELPPGVPPPRVPEGAQMTVERVELGRHLFYDTRLSGNGTKACASCHLQELAFTDGRARPIGATGEQHPRSSMSLVNVAYRDALTWANPGLRVLEDQLLVPMFGTHPVELGLLDRQEEIYRQLAKDRVYRQLFARAFPGVAAPVSTPNVVAALAAFVRSIVSFRSPFDRYRFANEREAISPAAERGMRLFFSQARCGGCHMAQNVTVDLGLNVDGGSKAATSAHADPAVFMFHNTGLYSLPAPMVYPAESPGLYAVTGDLDDVGKFRVASLRNVAITAPYMHDGSIATLGGVLDHYVNGGRAPNPLLSESIKPVTLTETQRNDLIAFLESLTDQAALGDPRWSDPWQPSRMAADPDYPSVLANAEKLRERP
jgi:cytochrome c peroxidase